MEKGKKGHEEDWLESTWFLLCLIGGYFLTYTGTGVTPKLFTRGIGVSIISETTNTVYGNIGGAIACLLVMAAIGWFPRLKKISLREYGLLAPSGVCTAVIIPTTTLLLCVIDNPMLALVLMRGSVVVLGRIVDSILKWMGKSTKAVTWEENVALVWAVIAVAIGSGLLDNLVLGRSTGNDLFSNVPAMIILGAYLLAYGIRLLLMGISKTHEEWAIQDGRNYFTGEEVFTVIFMAIILVCLYYSGSENKKVVEVVTALQHPKIWPMLGGVFFGLGAIPSVMLFMFKGKNMTFTALANRLTSLAAGVLAVVILGILEWYFWDYIKDWPAVKDWQALGCVGVSMLFLIKVELRRIDEKLAAEAKAKAEATATT